MAAEPAGAQHAQTEPRHESAQHEQDVTERASPGNLERIVGVIEEFRESGHQRRGQAGQADEQNAQKQIAIELTPHRVGFHCMVSRLAFARKAYRVAPHRARRVVLVRRNINRIPGRCGLNGAHPPTS